MELEYIGPLLANDIQFAKVLPHQNFVLYSIWKYVASLFPAANDQPLGFFDGNSNLDSYTLIQCVTVL